MYIIYQSVKHFFVCEDFQEVNDIIRAMDLDLNHYVLLKEVHFASELKAAVVRSDNENKLNFGG